MDSLYRFARQLVPSAHAADDLVQETAVRGLRSCHGFRGDSSLSTWLHRIMWNLAIDATRRSERELLVAEVEELWQADSYHLDPHVVAERAADGEQVRAALVRLPFIYRAAVVLHDSLGWSHAEIADRLDISEANSKQRVHRGRMLLATALADVGDRPPTPVGTLNCWSAREQVSDYIDGALAPHAASALEAHLAGCPTCPPLYASLVGSLNALATIRDADNVVPPSLAERIRRLS